MSENARNPQTGRRNAQGWSALTAAVLSQTDQTAQRRGLARASNPVREARTIGTAAPLSTGSLVTPLSRTPLRQDRFTQPGGRRGERSTARATTPAWLPILWTTA